MSYISISKILLWKCYISDCSILSTAGLRTDILIGNWVVLNSVSFTCFNVKCAYPILILTYSDDIDYGLTSKIWKIPYDIETSFKLVTIYQGNLAIKFRLAKSLGALNAKWNLIYKYKLLNNENNNCHAHYIVNNNKLSMVGTK